MTIIDLSHTISPDMPVYPGTAPTVLRAAGTIEEHGFRETEIFFHTHTGTHIDAPAHFLKRGKTLDELPLDRFSGSAAAVRLDDLSNDGCSRYDSLFRSVDFVLVCTGWSVHWGKSGYFHGYPVPSLDVATRLSAFDLKGVGIDTISMDLSASTNFPNHFQLLENDTLIIENLCSLESVIGIPFVFHCFPLKLVKADGSPTRAVAVTN